VREIKHKGISVASYFAIFFMNIPGISTDVFIFTKKKATTFLNAAIVHLPLPLDFVNLNYDVFCGIFPVF
jgi:hypothetical protein